VQPARAAQVDMFRPPESSAVVQARVAAARERQRARFADCSWRLNGQIPSPRLKDAWPLATEAQRMIDTETYRGRLTARGAVRVARLAWTVADLASVRAGRDIRPAPVHVDTALRLRSGEPLDLRAVEERAG
jgi:magnesium chelatase family protein